MRALVVIVTASLLAAGAPAAAKSVYKEFSEAWAARDESYSKDFVTQLEAANKAVAEFRAAVAEGRPDAEQTAAFKVAMDKAHSASKARGRGLLLVEFREFMADKPSAARVEMWVQEKVALMQRDESALAALQREIEGFPENTDGWKVVETTQKWVEAHGDLSGRLDEIQLIDANLRSYFVARGDEKNRSRSFIGALLGGMAAGLREPDTGFVAPPMPIMTRCSPSFSGVNCITN